MRSNINYPGALLAKSDAGATTVSYRNAPLVAAACSRSVAAVFLYFSFAVGDVYCVVCIPPTKARQAGRISFWRRYSNSDEDYIVLENRMAVCRPHGRGSTIGERSVCSARMILPTSKHQNGRLRSLGMNNLSRRSST